ncbi:MAG: hypothetical protein WBP38_13890 [Hyphomicrobium sp.]|jgi:hypothetical protein|nr:hypothetical protein [Hyphomicrobium sp.]
MTAYNAIRCIEAVESSAEIRLPVAYSHGGFAQMRQLAVEINANPLGPIPVPVADTLAESIPLYCALDGASVLDVSPCDDEPESAAATFSALLESATAIFRKATR